MAKLKPLPKMVCVGFRQPEPVYHHTESGSYHAYTVFFCEGCGFETNVPAQYVENILPGTPMFFKKCGCTEKQELTDYHDDCLKCGKPIYLTPGKAMFKKRDPSAYQSDRDKAKRELEKVWQCYCQACLDEVVAEKPCRNKACASIRGDGVVHATFGEQLFFLKKGYTFPPNNCVRCRTMKNVIDERSPVTKFCTLCERPFTLTARDLYHILLKEELFRAPTECPSCRSLTEEEREEITDKVKLKRLRIKYMVEADLLLKGDPGAVKRLDDEVKASRIELKMIILEAARKGQRKLREEAARKAEVEEDVRRKIGEVVTGFREEIKKASVATKDEITKITDEAAKHANHVMKEAAWQNSSWSSYPLADGQGEFYSRLEYIFKDEKKIDRIEIHVFVDLDGNPIGPEKVSGSGDSYPHVHVTYKEKIDNPCEVEVDVAAAAAFRVHPWRVKLKNNPSGQEVEKAILDAIKQLKSLYPFFLAYMLFLIFSLKFTAFFFFKFKFS